MSSSYAARVEQFDEIFEDTQGDWVAELVLKDPEERSTILNCEKLLRRTKTKKQAACIARILGLLHVDTSVVLAGILFHAVRNKEVDLEQVNHPATCKLLTSMLRMAQADGVSSTGARFLDRQSRDQRKNVRSMLIALIDDPRVAVLKLAERLAMLRSAHEHPPDVRKKIANEVLEFYCPLANRLGVWQLKWMLEDLSFAYLHEEEYQEIASRLAELRETRENNIARICEDLRWRLDRAGIKAKVSGRAKNIFAIWHKMQEKEISFDAVYDVEAVRVIVKDVLECYRVLGVVHTSWPPIPNTLDDYIANPKANGYRSIHTAVVGPRGRNLEVQVRTKEMHRAAELGVCAHWAYKDDDSGLNTGKVDWMREVLTWQEEMQLKEYIDFTRRNDAPQRIYISTPKGHVIDLPSGSTAVDFAYYIHTDIGNQCCGVKINGSEEALNVPLKTGQTVEVMTSSEATPDRRWLDSELGYVRTTRARRSVQEWFMSELESKNVSAGRDWLLDECSRMKIDVNVDKLARDNDYQSVEEMYKAVAVGERSVQDLLPIDLLSVEEHETDLLDSPVTVGTETMVQDIEIHAIDRPRLLLDITTALAVLSANVLAAKIESKEPNEPAMFHLKLELDSLEQTRRVINRLRAIPDVLSARRLYKND